MSREERLELIKRGWLTFEHGTSANNRRAKYGKLTANGLKRLAIETFNWETIAGAIARVLRPV